MSTAFMGKLYLVGPLSDEWQDVPLRALRVLLESSLIVVQNSDSVREWLGQGEICTPVLEIGDGEPMPPTLAALRRGDVAWLVTSLAEFSGPAWRLLGLLAEQGIEPLSVPGPSSVVAGLAISGLPADSLTFLGVLGPLSERRSQLEAVAHEPQTMVCEVTAEQLVNVLCDIQVCLGDRSVVVYGKCGVWRGQASEVAQWPDGERLTLVIEGARQGGVWPQDRVSSESARLLAAGALPREVAREIARRSGWPRRQVYQLIVSVRRED